MTRAVRKRGRKIAATAQVEARDKLDMQGAGAGIRSFEALRRLVQVYRNTMYQCYFPFLSESDLLLRWERGLPDSSEPSYMLLMAVCAVSAQSVAAHAVFDSTLLEGYAVEDSSSLYFSEAVSKIPTHLDRPQDLDYLRSFGLLALYSLRQGDHSDFHRYLGLCHSFVAQNSFHDESRWPDDLSLTEIDDRRRFFWCVYRLEIHSACVLGHMVRMPEAQVSVRYPRITPSMAPETQAWTAGWDYITDLFRLLEYAIFSLRGGGSGRNSGHGRPALPGLGKRPSPDTLLAGLAQLRTNKPPILQGLRADGPVADEEGDDDSDGALQSNRCRYMTVQIACAEALVQILALLHGQAPARDVMAVAEQFLEDVTKAPLIMFRVASSQIVHHLLGVGHMLHSASRHGGGGQYRLEARRLIAFLADLVKNLELDIPSAAEAGERLLRLAEATS